MDSLKVSEEVKGVAEQYNDRIYNVGIDCHWVGYWLFFEIPAFSETFGVIGKSSLEDY